jgi:ABC-type multidrug transport system fused ATPase/permease subunit
MKSQAKQYINKKQLFKTMALSLVQQIAVALSTFCLAQAGFNYDNPNRLIAWSMGSFAFHLLAPAVQIIIKRWESDLFFETYQSFLKKNLLGRYGSPLLWRRKDLKDSFISSISGDAEGYLGSILFVGLDVFAFVVSLVLGVLVLGATIDVNFLPAFAISGLLSYCLYRKMYGQVRDDFENEQVARTAYNGYILGAWDNVFFKNSSVIKRYENALALKYERAKAATRKSSTSSEYLIFTLGLVSAIPVIALVLWVGLKNASFHQTSALLALLATIPRQLNMLTTFRSVFQNLAAYIGFEAKFKVIHETAAIEESAYQDQIKLQKIKIEERHYESLTVLEDRIQRLKPGRYEIRGENGSGKSTLLLHLNATLNRSFYLPSMPNLAITESETSGSSGEKLLRHIDYLRAGEDQILLLDEWDANLDSANLLRTEQVLDELAKSKVIIEVRHRGEIRKNL